MKIDIDRLSEADLVDLNHRIVERLRLLQQMRSHVQMMEFKVGERVQFQPDGHPLMTGVLTRYNRRLSRSSLKPASNGTLHHSSFSA